jgi:hypothetical protein
MVTTVLECECGFEALAEDEDGLVVEIRRHAWEEHGMTLSLGQALLLASRAVEGSERDAHRRDGYRQKEEEK